MRNLFTALKQDTHANHDILENTFPFSIYHKDSLFDEKAYLAILKIMCKFHQATAIAVQQAEFKVPALDTSCFDDKQWRNSRCAKSRHYCAYQRFTYRRHPRYRYIHRPGLQRHPPQQTIYAIQQLAHQPSYFCYIRMARLIDGSEYHCS